MLLAPGGEPQRWAIDAAATTSIGHRCGCPARLGSIDVPSLRLRPGAGGQVPGGPGAGDLNAGNRERKEPGTGSPGTALPHLMPLPSRYMRQNQGCGSFVRRGTGRLKLIFSRPDRRPIVVPALVPWPQRRDNAGAPDSPRTPAYLGPGAALSAAVLVAATGPHLRRLRPQVGGDVTWADLSALGAKPGSG